MEKFNYQPSGVCSRLFEFEVEDDKITLPLKPVIRIATEEDKKKEEKNRVKEKEAFEICLERNLSIIKRNAN